MLKHTGPGVCCSLLMLMILLLSAIPISAQTQITTGVIQGTVFDEANAVVAGADVEVKNTDTNLTKNLKTDSDGRFVFLQLPSGRYTLTVTRQGYATLAQENLTLTVGQAINLNLNLKVSSVQERVTITAAPTIDTVRVESSSTINEIAISRTPVLGRKFEDLLTLTPGVSITQGPDGDEINFDGQRGIFNNVSLDGGDYNNGFFGEQAGGQRAAIDITLEAVKEFQVVATGASAEFGRTAGGIINVITKSGTNEVHGSLFHFQRLEVADLEHFRWQTASGFPSRTVRRQHRRSDQTGQSFLLRYFEQITGNLTRPNLSAAIGNALFDSSPDYPGE